MHGILGKTKYIKCMCSRITIFKESRNAQNHTTAKWPSQDSTQTACTFLITTTLHYRGHLTILFNSKATNPKISCLDLQNLRVNEACYLSLSSKSFKNLQQWLELCDGLWIVFLYFSKCVECAYIPFIRIYTYIHSYKLEKE